jgi:hypothetical protein
VSGPSPSFDQRDPTRWFVTIIIGIAVVAVMIMMIKYL